MFIKSGDSSNFLNATQGVEALVSGLDAGVEAAVQHLRRRREQDEYDRSVAVQSAVADWRAYAHALEQQNAQLKSSLAQLAKDYDKLESKNDSLQSTFIEYNALLVTRIRKLDEIVQRMAANEYAYSKMRVILLEKLAALSDPSTLKLITEEEQMRQLKEDRDYFMKHNDVRMGVPELKELLQKVGTST